MRRPTIGLDVAPEHFPHLLPHSLVEELTSLGEVIDMRDEPPEGRLDVDILITGWGSEPLPAHLPTGSPLRLVAHSAGTVRMTVPKDLLRRGLALTHAAVGMATAVAEQGIFFAMSLLRQWYQIDRLMLTGDYAAARSLGMRLGHTLDGARIGVVGASRMGRAFIARAISLGADVRVADPYLSDTEAEVLGVVRMELDELLRWGQLTSLQAPVNPSTVGMVDARRLSLIPDGAALINTARSALVIPGALEAELISGRISAALDVFDDEPLRPDSPLWGLPNVILTPHLGAATVETRRELGTVTVAEVRRFISGQPLKHAITTDTYDLLA